MVFRTVNKLVKRIFTKLIATRCCSQFPGGHSKWEPPDSISNSVVKTLSADDSVGLPM